MRGAATRLSRRWVRLQRWMQPVSLAVGGSTVSRPFGRGRHETFVRPAAATRSGRDMDSDGPAADYAELALTVAEIEIHSGKGNRRDAGLLTLACL
jgi:hypothetical protein